MNYEDLTDEQKAALTVDQLKIILHDAINRANLDIKNIEILASKTERIRQRANEILDCVKELKNDVERENNSDWWKKIE